MESKHQYLKKEKNKLNINIELFFFFGCVLFFANVALFFVAGSFSAGAAALSAVIWGACFILHVRGKIYAAATGGRDYRTDRGMYDRGFRELIRFYSDADPHKMDIDHLPVMDFKTADGVVLGHVNGRVIRRASDGEGNFLLAGRPGDGKTASIITTAINFNRDRGGGGVLAVDIKGDIYAQTHKKRNIKIFNPDDPRSCHFDPFSGVPRMTVQERCTFLEQLAVILVPDQPGDNAAYFVSGARLYFCGIALLELHKNINATLPEILKNILEGDAFRPVNEATMSDYAEARQYLSSLRGTNEKNAAGCYQTLCQAIRPVYMAAGHLLDGTGDVISVRSLETGDVYLTVAQDKLGVYAPVMALIIQSFLADFTRRPDRSGGRGTRKPVLFLIDEAPTIRLSYSVLQEAMASLRSKGVSIYLIIQSLAQLQELYGREGCRAIVDNCAYISVMSATDPESRKFFSDLAGTKKALRTVTTDDHPLASTSRRGRSVQETREPVLRPEDIGDLRGKVLIIYRGKYILADKPLFFL